MHFSTICYTIVTHKCSHLCQPALKMVHSIKEHAEALVVASKETGLEVNADKTKYMAMSQGQKAGQSHNIKNDNSSFERVEDFKYLGTT